MNTTLRDYLDKFMKIFLDDFTIYSDMDIHPQEIKLCFQKCREFGINLNPYKCVFMVFSTMILGFILSKEGKLLDPKKMQTIFSMFIPTNP
jgi:hypothetical protein